MTTERSYEGKLSELILYRTLRINLVITTVLWMVLTIGYYVLNLILKYLEGDMFMNSYTLAIGEIIAKLSGGLILAVLGLKRLHLLAFTFATVGCLLMAVFYKVGALTPYLIFFTRFGIGMGWIAVYFNIILLFPTVLKSTSAGIASIFGKAAGILAPFIVELVPPFNLLVLLGCTILALCI